MIQVPQPSEPILTLAEAEATADMLGLTGHARGEFIDLALGGTGDIVTEESEATDAGYSDR